MSEQEAAERQERLRALREEQHVVFRNYVPVDQRLKQNRSEPAAPADVQATADELAKRALEALAADSKEDASSLLKGKRANWDLKRDIESKRVILEERTELAYEQLATRSSQS